MPGLVHEDPVEYDDLSVFLEALAYPARLELLDVLRFPHTLGEIDLTPRRGRGAGSPDRSAARSTVLAHLGKLVEAELVLVEEVERRGRTVPRYVVNTPRLYAVVEEMRRLSVFHAGRSNPEDDTGTVERREDPVDPEGPCLVLVHGVYEGKVFDLDDGTAAEDRWVIGRHPDAAVALDYDPFVSLENSAVERGADGFRIRDLGSKNGTHVNWSPVPEGETEPLGTGSIVGVGRSILSFIPG